MSRPFIKMVIIPTPPSPSRHTHHRTFTPSPEQSLPILLVTTPDNKPFENSQVVHLSGPPFFASTHLFPLGTGTVIHEQTHTNPHEQQLDEYWHSKHVLLPVNLRDRNISTSRPDIKYLLHSIFPETINVSESRQRSHLLFQVQNFPPSPWPLTVGGVPLTILREDFRGRHLILPRQAYGNSSVSVCRNYNVDQISEKGLRVLGADINAAIQRISPEIKVIEIMITREHTMYIALENHVDISSVRLWLPGEIANCPVGYIHDSELQRPQWGVRPVTNGTTHPFQRTVSDDTPYEILRPGVMICSQKPLENEHPAHFGTTSGILVQNHYGHQFMTVAAHEIRQSATIWQPTWSDDIVGRVVLEISSTDIALVKLSENVIFSNETFTNLGVEPPKFTRLLNSDDGINLKADCYLNSPYTGFTEGHIFMKSVRIEASDHPTEDRSRYIMYNWMYMGQAEGNDGWDYPPDGTSGSVIWDEDGVILGFHQYYINKGPWEGFSVSVSAGELVEAGYSLAATEA